MQVVRNIKNYKPNSFYKVVTIGNYDGLHTGHKSIISKLTADSKVNNGSSILITFDPHPAEVLINNFKIDLIQTEKQFISSLEKEGVSTLVIEKFTSEYSKLTAEQFFKRIYDQLHFDKLLIGYDFKFGKDKLGNFEFLQKKSIDYNFKLEKIKSFDLDGTIVSSTKIRNLLSEGKITEANKFLGRNYLVSGKVVKGQGKGSQIGFPTLNLECNNNLFIKLGVYETKVHIDGQVYKSITNFGRAPTIKNQLNPVIEVHILNENINCYGKTVNVEFCSFIRPEMKFSGVDELIKQIKKDISSIS